MKNFSVRLQVYIFFCSLLIIAGIILSLLNQLDPLSRKHVFKSLIILSILFVLFPFIKTNSNWMVCYFFCFDREWWDKRVQRPRIFIYLVYFVFLYMISSSDNSNVNYYIRLCNNFILIFYLLLGVVLLGKMVWAEKFETAMLPQIKNIIQNDITIRKMSTEEISDIIEANQKNIKNNSIQDLELFLRGEKLQNKIQWIGTSGKGVITYTNLFFLIHSITEDGDRLFKRNQKRKFLQLICDNFEKFENEELKYSNLDSAYSGFNLRKYSN